METRNRDSPQRTSDGTAEVKVNKEEGIYVCD